ncbi:MAG: threonylcarbamoyl-AMP synthase [Candidatus Thermoplasmatota archaeon]|nr:threonylcarbamoyl-AMP synthase [Candidatus Thermoplasmatota archaeon]
MSVLKWDKEDHKVVMKRVQDEFARGLPVVLPTDTLYGLSAPVSSLDALKEIYRIKRRPVDRTLPIALGDIAQINDIALVDEWQEKLMDRKLPGPVTFILEARGYMSELVSKNASVAVRVPDHPIFPFLTARHGPLALTSANLHGSENLLTAEGIDRQFRGELLIIEDDTSVTGKASAMIDLMHGAVTVVRDGNLNMEEFMRDAHEG